RTSSLAGPAARNVMSKSRNAGPVKCNGLFGGIGYHGAKTIAAPPPTRTATKTHRTQPDNCRSDPDLPHSAEERTVQWIPTPTARADSKNIPFAAWYQPVAAGPWARRSMP